ncbi:hypothetical protein C8Q78DRAFT_1071983 [Trametes maxima]|nr:hypothetical protein C8Q78DRAFT_1071983 [Trametes maxima]
MATTRRSPPLRDWERSDKLNLELVAYGTGEKRVTVRFHLPKDRDTGRIQLVTMLMIRDVKHSKDWTCEWCGLPARESHVETLSWQHLEPPRLVIYIHFVCDMEARHVRQGIEVNRNFLSMVHGGSLGPAQPPPPPRMPGETYPLAGSCACCQRDVTAGKDDLKRCSRCKLTRYCGAECQKKDWARHKVTCGMVFSVNFENWG